jgi:hypothetical protein
MRQDLGTGVRGGHQYVTARLDFCPHALFHGGFINTTLHLLLPKPFHPMISFSGLPPEVAEAMCTPMHLILPSGPPSTPRLQRSDPGALYLGSISAVLDPSILKDHDIHHLVQVLDVPWLPASEQDGYECYRLDILDLESQDLRPHLEDAVEDIDSALRRGLNVLVHCQQVSLHLIIHLHPITLIVVF